MRAKRPTMREKYPSAASFIPASPGVTLAQLREASQACRGCDLYRNATQAVFGEGITATARARTRRLMLVGEQPGDQEDLQGHPFVGPAGKLLDTALADAGIDRSAVYVTNAVKHFKWTPDPRGKRRIHSKPSVAQVRACFPWLERELLLVRPTVVVPLGATAGQALLGPSFRVTAARGTAIPHATRTLAYTVVPTIHPSAILRAPDSAARERDYAAFVRDLTAAAALIV